MKVFGKNADGVSLNANQFGEAVTNRETGLIPVRPEMAYSYPVRHFRFSRPLLMSTRLPHSSVAEGTPNERLTKHHARVPRNVHSLW
jgi:hypothetical protein